MLVNVSAGEVTQGGSTITQQLVKNSLLDERARRRPQDPRGGLRRGGSSSSYTKDEILERYLNTVYLGNNTYGLQAAAETYFGKNVDQLDIWRGRVPRRAHPQPVGLRPDQPPGAIPGPLPPGGRPARAVGK